MYYDKKKNIYSWYKHCFKIKIDQLNNFLKIFLIDLMFS